MESGAAVRLRGTVCAQPMAGASALEPERSLRAGVLRGRLFFQTTLLVATARGAGGDRSGVELLLSGDHTGSGCLERREPGKSRI